VNVFPAPKEVLRCGPVFENGIGDLDFAGEHTSHAFMGYMKGRSALASASPIASPSAISFCRKTSVATYDSISQIAPLAQPSECGATGEKIGSLSLHAWFALLLPCPFRGIFNPFA
jgi:hypothetical protein